MPRCEHCRCETFSSTRGAPCGPLVNVYVDGEDVRRQTGVDTELRGGETVRVVAAIAGG